MLKKAYTFITNYKFILFLFLYVIFRVFTINLNNSEWGDSYRILRASEYLMQGSYPSDEKRPPFFSFLLTFNFSQDLIFSSRIWMIVISVLTLVVFKYFLDELRINLSENLKFFGLVFFAFNPLFMYWSMRIYADTLFLLIVIFSMFLYLKYSNTQKFMFLLPIPFILNLGILTRFEGYLLIASIFLGSFFTFKSLSSRVYLYLTTLLIFFGIILNPQIFFYQNPLASSYVDEAVSRSISIKEVMNFTSQFFYVLGSIFSIYLFLFSFKENLNFLRKNLVISGFVFLQFLLSAYWFAAVPRLFLQLLPFLIVLFIISFSYYEKNYKPFSSFKTLIKDFTNKDRFNVLTIFLLIGFYVLSQLNLRLPFLLNKKTFILFVVILTIYLSYLLIFGKKRLFLIFSLILSFSWGIMFISLEKDVFKVLNKSVLFLSQSKSENDLVLTNDVSGMTRFYLKDKIIYSEKLNSGSRPISENDLKGAKYVLVTNEHNVDLSFTPSKYPFLEVISIFKETLYGREFFTVIAKVREK